LNGLRGMRPTPALIVAMVALVAALSGAAVALPGKGTVKKNDIANGAVTKKKIADAAVGSKQIIGKSIKGNRLKDGAVKAKQIADATITDKKIADGTITGAKVADETLSDTKISDYDVLGDNAAVRVAATEAGSEAAAQAAAPETLLFSKGQVSLYAKCFRDTTGAGTVFGEVYARTTANGAILQGTDTLPSADATLLDTNTAEEDAEVDTETIATANAGNVGESEAVLIAPNGADHTVIIHTAVKQGSFAGGNGAFGDGNVCLFGGTVSG
jgi:hypothetical protein